MVTRPGISMTCFTAPDSVTKAAKQTKEDLTKSYIERFQTIGGQLSGNKAGDEDSYLKNLPKEDSEIIKQYKSKLEQENAQIITAKNRWEVNQTLQDYDQMMKDNLAAQQRNKVTYVHPEHENEDDVVNPD